MRTATITLAESVHMAVLDAFLDKGDNDSPDMALISTCINSLATIPLVLCLCAVRMGNALALETSSMTHNSVDQTLRCM